MLSSFDPPPAEPDTHTNHFGKDGKKRVRMGVLSTPKHLLSPIYMYRHMA